MSHPIKTQNYLRFERFYCAYEDKCWDLDKTEANRQKYLRRRMAALREWRDNGEDYPQGITFEEPTCQMIKT